MRFNQFIMLTVIKYLISIELNKIISVYWHVINCNFQGFGLIGQALFDFKETVICS
jgi:hypothetical protein